MNNLSRDTLPSDNNCCDADLDLDLDSRCPPSP
jgi:hypothetical protein